MLFLKYKVVTISFILSNLRYFKVKQDFVVVIQSLTHVWLRLHELQHTRLPCSSLSLWLCSNSCPLRQPCHPTISSCSPLLLLPSIFPASESFLIFWLFASCAQSIGTSTSTLIFPMNIQDWFPLRWTGLISFVVQGTFKSLLWHHSLKASVLQCSLVFMIHLSHPCVTSGKAINLTIWTIVGKVMFLLFNTLCRLIIVFLPRRKRLLISWL